MLVLACSLRRCWNQGSQRLKRIGFISILGHIVFERRGQWACLVGKRMPQVQRRVKTLGSPSDLKLGKPNFFLIFDCLDKVGGSCWVGRRLDKRLELTRQTSVGVTELVCPVKNIGTYIITHCCFDVLSPGASATNICRQKALVNKKSKCSTWAYLKLAKESFDPSVIPRLLFGALRSKLSRSLLFL